MIITSPQQPELIAIINGAISSKLHDVYWHGNKQEKSAIRPGCDYGPIKKLPDHLVSSIIYCIVVV